MKNSSWNDLVDLVVGGSGCCRVLEHAWWRAHYIEPFQSSCGEQVIELCLLVEEEMEQFHICDEKAQSRVVAEGNRPDRMNRSSWPIWRDSPRHQKKRPSQRRRSQRGLQSYLELRRLRYWKVYVRCLGSPLRMHVVLVVLEEHWI